MVHDITICQFIKKPSNITIPDDHSDNQSYNPATEAVNDHQNWLEVGAITLGPILFEASLSSTRKTFSLSQSSFLKTHDAITKRLWFLWQPEHVKTFNVPSKVVGKCGCLGGCYFFSKKDDNWNQFFFESSSSSSTSNMDVSCWPTLLSRETPAKSRNADQKHYFHLNHGYMEDNVLRNRKKGTTLSAEALGQLPSSSRVLRQHSCESKPTVRNSHPVSKGSITSPPSLHSNISCEERKEGLKFNYGFRQPTSLALSSAGLPNANSLVSSGDSSTGVFYESPENVSIKSGLSTSVPAGSLPANSSFISLQEK